MKSYISLEESIKILETYVKNNNSIEVNLIDGLGLKNYENVYSSVPVPLFNKSAMDGYAIKIKEEEEVKEREVIDKIFAGEVSDKVVTFKEAIKIMTGAQVPIGANAVIKQEDITLIDNKIILNKKPSIGDNICFQGEDIKKGDLLLEKGKIIDYADIGILSSVGINKVSVYKRPVIALFTTGNEVVDIDKDLIKGKIYNSNKYLLLGRLKELGFIPIIAENKKDESKAIGETLLKLSEKADLIITTGGVSVGEKDLLKEAIDYINGEKLFWKINIKPGSAILASKINNSIVISLSGNPTAALTTFELLVKPILNKLMGESDVKIKKEKAFLKEDYVNRGKKRRFVRGNYYNDEGKMIVSITQKKSGNGIITSTKNSNCIVEFSQDKESYQEGELVEIIRL